MPLDDLQKEEVRKILTDGFAAGKKLGQIARENKKYKYGIYQDYNIKWKILPRRKVSKRLSDLQKEEVRKILTDGRAAGKTVTQIAREDKKHKLCVYQFYDDKFGIFPKKTKTKRTDDKKLEVVECAEKNGTIKASQKYDINANEISKWKGEFKDPDEEDNEVKKFTKQERIKILKEARKYNILTNSKKGLKFVANKYKVASRTPYYWNAMYKIVPLKSFGERQVTPIEDEVLAAEQLVNYDSVSAAMRGMKRSRGFLNRIIKDYDVKLKD